ncbi:response regulator, partial [Desulfobacterales bacterium HSG16]|nr:response regulator [Desulfobacterales bacterium HSG16]
MGTTAKILVVDDEKRICLNVEKILAKNNYEVIRATNAQDALDKLAKDSFSLMISDIVMPGMNGLELLKLVKNQWPLTKAMMMTAYASTNTAVKAIRLGALDYIPKPFTPDELRSKVGMALGGEMPEVTATPQEQETIDVIDADMPFEMDEVAKYTGEDYAKMYGRSDMPVVEVPKAEKLEKLENFCEMGNMVCNIYKKLGATCKGGLKTSECPQLKAKKKKAGAKGKKFDSKKLIGIDQPFNYEEVISVTGPEYVAMIVTADDSFLFSEDVKKNNAQMTKKKTIDV